MQIFTNGKQHFYSFLEFYVIHLKIQGVKIFDHSNTLKKYEPKLGLHAKRVYIGFWPIFIFRRIELIFDRLTCFDMKRIVP